MAGSKDAGGKPKPMSNNDEELSLATVTTEQWGIAQLLARSHYFQGVDDPAQAFTKILAGAELGFGPIASMQGVYIVKDRVTLSANLVAAAIQKSGKYRYRVTTLDESGCSISFFERTERGWDVVGESVFTSQDAARAGLRDGNYSKFPRNMYFSRALTNGARWYCPEVFNGPVYTPEELGDLPEGAIDIQEMEPPRADVAALNGAPDDDAEARSRSRFWATVRGWGLNDEQVHDLLKVETLRGYPGGYDAALRDATDRRGGVRRASDEATPITMRSPLGQRFAQLVEEAAALDVPWEDLKVSYPASYEEVVRKGEKLRDRIDAVRSEEIPQDAPAAR